MFTCHRMKQYLVAVCCVPHQYCNGIEVQKENNVIYKDVHPCMFYKMSFACIIRLLENNCKTVLNLSCIHLE